MSAQADEQFDEPEQWPGYHECPCCDEILCGGPLSEDRCDGCVEAGCEIHHCDDEHEDCDGCELDGLNSEGCQAPSCPDCETPMSFMNDGQWHDNCDPDECERRRTEGHV